MESMQGQWKPSGLFLINFGIRAMGKRDGRDSWRPCRNLSLTLAWPVRLHGDSESPGLSGARDLLLPSTKGSGDLTLLQTHLCNLICKASDIPQANIPIENSASDQ